jgi:mitochondrial import receptor subunit TOM70
MNVLPLVNKGLALYQWKQNAEAAEACCQEALQIDPECDAAVATIAQLCLQQGQLGRAVEMFAKQAELARTELELTNALTYQYVRYLFMFPISYCGFDDEGFKATRAQQEFLKNYPDMAAQLTQIARGMMA